ncbi:hypothetical protein GS888_24725 [Rhodococcus hoagii]|nr:hypothetical protein [Prescottella equi]NKU31536.1 hypothetical protein [Prescottella equi]NKU32251.1 hypothetical protein [Prescottella equi]
MEAFGAHDFVNNYPFSELLPLGWRVEHVDSPKDRGNGEGVIRVARFVDGFGRHMVFDVNAAGGMSLHATCMPDDSFTVVANYAGAALRLAASSPFASAEELCALPGVEFGHRFAAI